MLELLGLVLALAGAYPARSEVGVSPTFLPVERMNNGILACDGARRWLDPDELLVAHRSLPCGSIVVVQNPVTGAATLARVYDRGPYGALLPDGTWLVKRRATDPGIWRGILDKSPGVTRAVGVSHGRVILWWWPGPRRPRGGGA